MCSHSFLARFDTLSVAILAQVCLVKTLITSFRERRRAMAPEPDATALPPTEEASKCFPAKPARKMARIELKNLDSRSRSDKAEAYAKKVDKARIIHREALQRQREVVVSRNIFFIISLLFFHLPETFKLCIVLLVACIILTCRCCSAAAHLRSRSWLRCCVSAATGTRICARRHLNGNGDHGGSQPLCV